MYLLELRPDEKSKKKTFKVAEKSWAIISDWDGFILDEKELIPTARETWEGVRVVAEAVLDRIVAGKSTAPRGRQTLMCLPALCLQFYYE